LPTNSINPGFCNIVDMPCSFYPKITPARRGVKGQT